MRKNIIFVVIFIAVILGLIQLHTVSSVQTVNVQGIVNILYPTSIEARNDIPFEVLVNPEDKKLLPDSVNIEKFRPNLILLQKGFNEKDSSQLKEFPNIIVNAITIPSFNASILETEYASSISGKLYGVIQHNAELTSSIVSDWKALPLMKINGATALRFQYKLENSNKRILNIYMSYLFKDDKQVEVTLSTPNNDKKRWFAIYNSILNNLSISTVK